MKADPLKAINAALGWNKHPRNGKIARLPEATRHRINQMLDDGLPYHVIIRGLYQSALRDPDFKLLYPISEMNLSNWFHGGYQDWCRQQAQKEFLKGQAPVQCHLAPAKGETCRSVTPNSEPLAPNPTKSDQITPAKG